MSTLTVRAFTGTTRTDGGTIVGMRPMDLPSSRSLGDRADAFDDAGGRARPPAELLDQLRERLRQLPDSHPSAAGEPSARAQPATSRGPGRTRGDEDSPREQAQEPGGQAQEPGEQPDQQAESRGGQTASGDQRAPGRDAVPADQGLSAGGGALDSGGVQSGGVQDGGIGKLILPADYRPWFMSGDPTTPWFAVDEGL